MQNTVLEDTEHEDLNKEESESQTCESDNAWQLKSVSSEELKKWELEKERYDEIIEYIKEVDEILNIIKPFPRQSCENVVETQRQTLSRCESQSRYGLDHLENIIKLVEQLKQLKENNTRLGERTCYLKDLKKLREHKRRLKNEELEFRSRSRVHSSGTPEDNPDDFTDSLIKARKVSSTASEKFEEESEGWQHKRKSLCLPPVEGQNKSKVSKWTKVKEAFHWERTSVVLKPNRKELPSLDLPEDKVFLGEFSPDAENRTVFDDFSQLPPPPPPPPVQQKTLTKSEDLLSVRPASDFPSSSSSDRLDDYFLETKGIKTPDAECGSQVFVDDVEDVEKMVRKSSSGEFPQHLCKEESRLSKSNKTTWGKVKDIIQTRKDSLKKKPKKRASDEFKKRRKLSASQYSDQFEDLSSPEDKTKAECIPKAGYDFPEDSSTAQSNVEEKCTKKLTPALTVTLPSTEELRSFSSDELEKKEIGDEDKMNILGQFSCQAQYCEDKTKSGKIKSGQNQRLSRWIKVKRVFLTSATPTRPNYSPGNDSSPTSQNKSSGFFSDMESDELSSGEWIDDKSPTHEKPRISELESQSVLIQEDIRKSYNELQKKLSQEFDQKLREWEMKSEVPTKNDDLIPKQKDEADSIPKFRKTKESMAVPLPNINDLSPEFKKKLNDWKKMKTSQSSSSVSSSATREEVQGQNIKIRIGEWQPWRNRSSQKCYSEDFSKKSDEGRPPSSRKKEKEESEGGTGRRDSKRRDSTKKVSHSRTPSGGENIISGAPADKDGRFVRRTQKMKDYQWVEKELQKIEREKMRLEQEKEKYLEREARLEKMKKTMGTTSPTEEILVRTPAGFFRFKGISQKFTKKLYEWEKARGIAPEASTFALLEESAKTNINGDFECDGSVSMHRSKSTGSVPELPSALLIQSITHHPSSLSLNDMEELKSREEDDLDESISSERIKAESEEPEAVIVDIEDIVEETAVLADPPTIKTEVPVYSFAAEKENSLLHTPEGVYVTSQPKVTKEPYILNKNEDAKVKESEVRKLSFGTVHETHVDCSTNQNQKNSLSKEINNSENAEIDSKSTSRDSSLSTVYDQKQDIAETKEESLSPPPKSKNEKNEFIIPILNKSPKTYFECSANPEIPRRKSSEDWKNRSNHEKSSLQDALRVRNDPEALKKKIKEKITLMQRLSMEGPSHYWRSSDYDQLKIRREKEEKENWEQNKKERIIKIEIEDDCKKNSEEKLSSVPSVNVFVPTTRKIISPVKTTQGSTPLVCSYVIDDVKSEDNADKVSTGEIAKNTKTNDCLMPASPQSGTGDNKNEMEPEKKRDIGIPPLPHSPKTYKKLNAKEAAPSIRMIIAKYNQKISEHENANEKRNDSGSPTIWRSPVFGRRTQEKIDKYTGEVQKSVSLDNMKTLSQSTAPTPQREGELKGILKSSSVGVMKVRQGSEPKVETSTYLLKENSPSVLRALKIQKAKEDFLSGKLGGLDNSAPSTLERPKADQQAKKTENAVETIEQSITKSISAETVSSERSQAEEKPGDSRPLQKTSSKFDISSIKSKFRKIRMRKEKEPKMNAVAALCRQSLLIEVPKCTDESQPSSSKSCPSSPVMDRNKNDKTNDHKDKKSK